MRKIPLLCVLIGLLMVVGCAQEDEGVSEVVEVETAVTTPTPTQTPIPATSTPSLTDTPLQMPTETPTSTETIVPSSTPLPTPTPLPSVPLADGSYKLAEYDLENFIHLIEQCNNNIEHRHEDCNEGTSSLNYDRILDNDFKRFFTDGFPEAITFVEEYPFQSNEYFFYVPQVLQTILLQGLIDYINEYEIIISPDVNIPDLYFSPLPVDFGSEHNHKWVIHVSFSRYNLSGWLLLGEDEDGTYHLLDFLMIDPFYSGSANIEYDFTGDGFSEMMTIGTRSVTGKHFTSIDILLLQNEQFQLLKGISFGYFYANGFVDHEIIDANQNGRPEIHVHWKHSRRFECFWEQTDVYEWDGAEFQKTTTGGEAPETAVCNVAQGINGRANVRDEVEFSLNVRTSILETALQELTMENAPSIDYLALVHVHLAMMYAGQGEDEKAIELLANIQEFPSVGNQYVQFVNESWQANLVSPVQFCNFINGGGENGLSTLLGTEIEQDLYYIGYPIYQEFDPEKICPLDDLIANRLNTFTLDAKKTPVEAFADIDLPFVPMLTGNFDEDSQIEWLGYLDLNEPKIILADASDNEWTLNSIYNVHSSDLVDFQTYQTDFNSDGQTELVLSLELINYPDNIFYYVLLIEKTEAGFERTGGLSLKETPVLDSIQLDDFQMQHYQTSIWTLLKDEYGIEDDLRTFVNELAQRVIDQERPLSTLTDLETLLSRLPDDAEVEPLRHQLLFLRGYHYELSGEEETAVSHYTTLIQQAPDSPWSWLAWARLKPE
ncbi:MAG: tetratricopeptide repeat-containing protein [Chloroflexi bacterium]|nr:MAG: tetratricopeptide repeat-containing protein [Chloroflexota bacterium]